MKNIYVVNKSCHDFSEATKIGNVIFMTTNSMNRFNLEKMHRVFSTYLEESHPEDFIVISGLTNMSVVASTIFASKHKRLNLLLWDSKRKKYKKESIFFKEYSFKKKEN